MAYFAGEVPVPQDPVTPREVVPPEDAALALDLTSEAVRLLERDGGDWAELGRAPLAGGDFRARIDALRRAAEDRGSPPVTIWLPPEQVIVGRYVLGRDSGDGDEALRRLVEDTDHRAGELLLALSPAGEGELVTVLATLRRTVDEALDYARRWGFRPVAVSTRVAADHFGAAGPVFAPPRAAPRRFGWWRAAAAGVAVLAVGLGAWGAQDLAQDLMPPDEPAAAKAEVSATAAMAMRDQPRPAVERPANEGAASPTVARLSAEPLPTAPARTAPPEADAPANLPADLAPRLVGIERSPAERPEEPQEEILLAAGDMAPLRVPGRPVPRPAASTGASVEDEPVETEGSDTPAIEPASNSRLAVASAPRPAARPERASGSKLAHRAGTTPPRVGSAASQAGLTLDTTSLIGVIDARSGREALLRLSSGDFRKVTLGDTVAGWRVSAIGQDTMRLTRGGESRTLLLVTR